MQCQGMPQHPREASRGRSQGCALVRCCAHKRVRDGQTHCRQDPRLSPRGGRAAPGQLTPLGCLIFPCGLQWKPAWETGPEQGFFFFFPLFFFLLLNSWNPLCKGNLTVKLKTDKRIFFSPSQLVGATDKGPWIWKHLKSRVSETLTHNAYMKGWYDILQSPAESFLIYTKGGLRRSS